MNILNLISVFIIKIIDNVLSTSKTLLIQKNKAFLAGFSVAISQVIFYKLINAVTEGGDLTMYIISIASGFGTYLAIYISNKFSKDRLFVNVILSDNKEAMMELREFLIENKINIGPGYGELDAIWTIACPSFKDTKFVFEFT